MAKEMTKAEKNELAKNEMPAWAGGGKGTENTESGDLIVPRLGLIQALSPQIKKTAPEFIEGADQGMLFNTVSGELYGDSIVFVPCYYKKEYVIWKNREAGGGFCGSFDNEIEANEAAAGLGIEPFGKKKEPLHEVQETANHYGLVLRGDNVEQVVLSLSRAGMKTSRQLLTQARMAGGDYFASQYKLTASVETNSNGDEYWGIRAQRIGWVTEEIYREGEKVYEAVSGGKARASEAA